MYGLPPFVLECPECGERYLISNPQNTPSEKAVVYSDGFFFDELNVRTPFIIGCVTCELGFFPENGKLIAEPTWDEVFTVWNDVKWAKSPTPSVLAIELRVRKLLLPDHEIALRKEFWYAGNYTSKGIELRKQNIKFNEFWNKNLIHVEELYAKNYPKNFLIRAEINRQLGIFDQANALLMKCNKNIGTQVLNKIKMKEMAPFIVT